MRSSSRICCGSGGCRSRCTCPVSGAASFGDSWWRGGSWYTWGWSQLAAAELSPALREVVVAYEATVQAVGTALGALDRQLAQRARRDPRVARLETMPGVGPVCAQTLVAAVDTIDRFATAKKLVAYAG